jgi:hypothetical protein
LDQSNLKKLSKIVFREGARNKVIIDEPFLTMFSSSSCDQDDKTSCGRFRERERRREEGERESRTTGPGWEGGL